MRRGGSIVDSQQIDDAPARADAYYLEVKAIPTGHPKFSMAIQRLDRFEVLRSRATPEAEDRVVSLAAENIFLRERFTERLAFNPVPLLQDPNPKPNRWSTAKNRPQRGG